MTFNAHNNILLFWREILESADYTCEFSSIYIALYVALSQKRYSWRHDSVLLTLEDKLRQRLSTHNKSPPKKRFKVEFVSSTSSKKRVSNKKKAGAKMSCLLGSATDWKIIIDYTMAPVGFPVHICVTNERPDVVLYSDSLKRLFWLNLRARRKKILLMPGHVKRLSIHRFEIRYRTTIGLVTCEQLKLEPVVLYLPLCLAAFDNLVFPTLKAKSCHEKSP